MTVPAEIKIGVWMWIASWPISFWLSYHFGLALFLTSYLAIFTGLWKKVQNEN